MPHETRPAQRRVHVLLPFPDDLGKRELLVPRLSGANRRSRVPASQLAFGVVSRVRTPYRVHGRELAFRTSAGYQSPSRVRLSGAAERAPRPLPSPSAPAATPRCRRAESRASKARRGVMIGGAKWRDLNRTTGETLGACPLLSPPDSRPPGARPGPGTRAIVVRQRANQRLLTVILRRPIGCNVICVGPVRDGSCPDRVVPAASARKSQPARPFRMTIFWLPRI